MVSQGLANERRATWELLPLWRYGSRRVMRVELCSLSFTKRLILRERDRESERETERQTEREKDRESGRERELNQYTKKQDPRQNVIFPLW